MFSTQLKTEIIIVAKFILSPANALNLAQSKELLFGKEPFNTLALFVDSVDQDKAAQNVQEDCLL